MPWWAIALATVALGKAVALCAYPFLAGGRRTRLAAVLVLGAAVLPLPLLVPLDRPYAGLVRFLIAVHSGVMAFKLWDLHVGHRVHGRPPFGTFVGFILARDGLHFVLRRRDDEPGPGTRGNLLRLARGLAEGALGVVLLRAAFGADLGRYGFWVDHSAKWLALYPALDGLVTSLVALTRLAGQPARDVYRDPILARTPAEFWRRYNRPVNQYLFEDVFRPAGGVRHPARGLLVAFAVSAVLHEYVFAAASGRVLGYQIAFFLLHGVGSVATMRLRPRGGWAVLAWLLHAVWLLGTLAIFTASVVPILDPLVTVYPHGGLLP